MKERFRIILMLSEDTNQCHKSNETPFIIFQNLDSLNDRIDGCKILLRNHLQQKYVKILYQIFQNKQGLYRNKDCIENFVSY